jgi:cytoskeletal protein RodZ
MAGTDQQLARIAEVQKKYTPVLMKKQHVVGVSVGPKSENGKTTGEFALIVMVDEKVPAERLAPQDRLPIKLEGIPVVVHPINTVYAL